MASLVYQACRRPLHWMSPAPSTQHLNGLPRRSGLWCWPLAARSVSIEIPCRRLPSSSIAAWCNLLACKTHSWEALRFAAMLKDAPEQ